MNKKINYILNLKRISFVFIALFSLFISLYYGFIGIFPIDSFLIFDGGYKVLNNFHPFKDYWSITGPLLDYIQALLFFSFGTSWLSYTLHAALINCLLAIITFNFFLKLGIKIKISIIFSVSISILAYPSTGTPFMDHHAAIFSLISLIFLILSLKHDKKNYWYLSAFFLSLSFFSKQIPSGYLFIFYLIIFLVNYYFIKNSRNIIYFLYGGLTVIICFLFLFKFFDISLNKFFIQYILYPISIGESRILNINFDFKNTISQFKFIHFSILLLFFCMYHIFLIKNKNKENKVDIVVLICVIISSYIFLYTQIITRNQILIFFLIPFNLSISYFFSKKYVHKKNIIFFIFLILIISTIKFHIRFNENKKFMEFEKIDIKNLTIDASILDVELKGLNWLTPHYPSNPKKELEILNNIKNLIIRDKNKKIIVSDYQILPYLTKNSNFAPNKWFDDLSVPNKKNKFNYVYRDFFSSKIKEQKVVNVYVVGRNKLELFLASFNHKNDCLEINEINELLIKLNIKNCY